MLAEEIAKAYLQFHKKYTPKVFSLAKVQESKWWPYFLKCAMEFGNKEGWDTYKFVEAQFETKGDIFPFDLAKKEAWKIFEEYKLGDKDFGKYIAMNLVATYKHIKQWSKEHGYDTPNYRKYFSDDNEQFFIKRKSYSFYLFSVCRSFYSEFYNALSDTDKDSLIDLDELMKMRAAIYTNPKLKDKMKEVLRDEFV
jgi:hypothetical protein